jgi:GntR family transcriptional regulator, arabinose operon transcriptional repressor
VSEQNYNRPLYVQLMDVIKGEIATGKLAAGSRLPNTLDLAQKHGVSHITVRQAMSGLVQEGLLTRRPYHGTMVAFGSRERLLATDYDRHVVLLTNMEDVYLSSFYVKELIEGVAVAARRHDCRVDYLSYSDFASFSPTPNCLGFLSILPSRDDILKVKRLGYPTMMLDHYYDRTGVGFVRTDNAYGITLAVEHLTGLGHERILHVHRTLEAITEAESVSIVDRLKSFKRNMQRRGLEWEGYTVSIDQFEQRTSFPPHTAIILDSRPTALRALDAINERGIRYPEDVSIVSYDDLESAVHMISPMTVVKMRLVTIGEQAVEYLLDEDGSWISARELVKPDLIVRRSTRRIERDLPTLVGATSTGQSVVAVD